MDRGACWATVHGVTKSLTGLSACAHVHTRAHTHTHTPLLGEKECSDQEGGVRQAGSLSQG